MGRNLTDIEKVKIDILRDALKDAIDTVRALDRKIVFLTSFNGIFLGLVSTLFFKKDILEKMTFNIEVFYISLGVLIIFWIFLFFKIMNSISPQINPIEVFKLEEDKNFSNNTFFIFTDGKENYLDLETLSKSYSEIDSYSDLKKLLYKEIGKVSYIRDKKIKNINSSIKYTLLIISIFILILLLSIIYPYIENFLI
jgi:hypothetical protein